DSRARRNDAKLQHEPARIPKDAWRNEPLLGRARGEIASVARRSFGLWAHAQPEIAGSFEHERIDLAREGGELEIGAARGPGRGRARGPGLAAHAAGRAGRRRRCRERQRRAGESGDGGDSSHGQNVTVAFSQKPSASASSARKRWPGSSITRR